MGSGLETNGEKVPEPLAGFRYRGIRKVRVSPAMHCNVVIAAEDQHISISRYPLERLASISWSFS
ncbi:toxin-antitoxin system HicB family antitoxin [Zhihengliuella halotolerans]|uniref:toxin-antitoxin system HicB family antitoxin n=1 Tax=Zhihengliuella halotolerans TaxID=370736 RepID=UPI003BF85BE9